MNPGVGALPGFVESVRILLIEERYAATDVALMFGVSRERIRQLIVRAGIEVPDYPRGLRARRVWDDEANRFRPVPLGEIREVERAERWAERRLIRERVREGYRAHVIAALTAFARSVDRPVTASEAWYAVSGRWQQNGAIIQMLQVMRGGGAWRTPGAYAEAMADLARRTGIRWVRAGHGPRGGRPPGPRRKRGPS